MYGYSYRAPLPVPEINLMPHESDVQSYDMNSLTSMRQRRIPQKARHFLIPRRGQISPEFGIYVLCSLVVIFAFSFFQNSLESHGILLYNISYAVISALFLKAYHRHHRLDPFCPSILSIVLLWFYSAAGGSYVEKNGFTHHGDMIDHATLGLYYIACLVGLAAIGIGVIIASERHPISSAIRLNQRVHIMPTRFSINEAKLMRYTPILAICCLQSIIKAFDPFHVAAYGDWALSSRVERMSLGAEQGLKEAFLYEMPLSLVIAMAVFLMFRSKSTRGKFVGSIILLMHATTCILGGYRGTLVQEIIVVLIFIHYRVKKLSLRIIIPTSVILYCMLTAFSFLRVTNDPITMGNTIMQWINTGDTSAIQMDRSGELLSSDCLMRLIKGIRAGETDFTYGLSILSEIAVFIPRALYPARPLPQSEQYLLIFYPGVREMGGGYGDFYIMDGYWAGGLIGIILLMCFYGYLIQCVYKWFEGRERSDFTAICYAYVFCALVVEATRTGVILSFKNALMVLLPFFIIYMIPAWHTKLPPYILMMPSEVRKLSSEDHKLHRKVW